jgi:ribulose-phosphate 3-epimerase
MILNIVPTITTDDTNKYKQLVDTFHQFAKRVHVDVTDGQFATTTTIAATGVWWPKGWTTDVHMMVEKPSEYIPVIKKIHPGLVIFHAEVEEDLLPTFDELRQGGIKVGVALQKPTFPGSIKPVIEAADHVLIFSGDLGKQGGTADMLQVEKVRLIRGIKKDVEIGWDGGASLNNIRAIARSGVNVINVGSAITTASDAKSAYAGLLAESDKHGVAL